MIVHWTQAMATLALQHLWHSALLFAFAAVLLARSKLSAEARSWALCAAFALAAASPLLVLLPREQPTARIVVQQAAPQPEGMQAAIAPAMPISPRMGTPPAAANNPTTLLQGLALVWLLGTLHGLLRLGQGWWQARRLHRSAHPAPTLDALLGSELPTGASAALSDRAAGPMVVGLLAPRILVPRHLAATLAPDALRDLLLHEAAHVRRRDLWVSAAQRALIAVYWWSPFLRLLGKRLDLAREMACDARAAARTGSGRGYADSLLTGIAGLSGRSDDDTALAVGMSAQRSGLSQRIDGLLSLDTRAVAPAVRAAWAGLCVLALLTHVTVTVAATPRLGKAVTQASDARRTSSPALEQLLSAAANGESAEVQRLVAAGVPVDTHVSGDGTALITAARHGQLDTVNALLALGAQPDLASIGDGNPLIAAARRSHLPVVKRLVAAGADVNRVVPFDETPLINAARSGDVATVAYLVDRGADVNLGVLADNGQWRSPLNQSRNDRVRAYLTQRGAIAGRR